MNWIPSMYRYCPLRKEKELKEIWIQFPGVPYFEWFISLLCPLVLQGSFLEDGRDMSSIAHGGHNSVRVHHTQKGRRSRRRRSECLWQNPKTYHQLHCGLHYMIFFNGCCFTAVVPSVPFYLQILDAPETFLGWVVSFYSLGQIMGSPLGGYLTNKLSCKKILTISSSLGFLSSCLLSFILVPLPHIFGFYMPGYSRAWVLEWSSQPSWHSLHEIHPRRNELSIWHQSRLGMSLASSWALPWEDC